ncbi:threonine/serine exporter family protein [Facklamia sp. P12945]|uniref:threonine/serine exporter family protein n=1 Tax=unclassified Facklamia TaxID=2622293 RepID=UPI003D168878
MELNHLILRLVASYLATVAAAINVNAPRKFIYWSGIPGIISYAVYLFVLSHTNTFIATFIGSLIVSIMGQWMSRKFKTVVNVFYIPAFFLYVPGIAIYETAEYFMQNNLIAASQSFYQALVTALAIGLAVFVVDSAMDTYKYHLNKRSQAD